MSDNDVTSSQRDSTEKDAHAAANVQFPYRLHELLDEVDASVICWLPESNAFKVFDKQTFTEKTLPHYFNATKYKSFQRNLNLWGFQTIQEGPNKGGCYHPLFIRGNREKVHYMTRQKVKGSQGKAPAKSATKIPLTQGQSSLPSLAEIAVATNPGLMTALKEAKNSIFSEDELKALPFMKKLHHILAQPDMGDCIGWTPDGRCIRVIDPFKFLDKAQSYFDHTSFSSFLVELESYGFKKVTHMGIAECYYHDLMIRGCHHLCKYTEDTKSAKKFVSKDPATDLEIDQAFGMPSLLPQVPMATLVNMEAPVMLEMQRQQQMAALQVMGGMVPAMAMGGLNQPILMQHASTTPLSNYFASTTHGGADGSLEKGGKKKKAHRLSGRLNRRRKHHPHYLGT